MNRIFLIFLIPFLFSCSKKEELAVPLARVIQGTFVEELTEEGTIRAVNAQSVFSPNISYRYGSLKIASIVEDGSEVQAGDTLVVFSPAEIKKAIIDAEQKLEIANAEYEKMKATQESEIEDLKADLEISKISHQISEINFDNARFESDITKREIQLKLETAKISLQRAKEQIDNKKRIHKEELLQKKLSMNQLIAILKEANASMASLFVISPNSGIASVKDNWMTGQKFQAGDQPYSSMPIIDLPDLSKMKVELKINEVDVAKITLGLESSIKADAYADTAYTGKITYVANLAQPKDRNGKIKVFPTEILIDGDKNTLLPGLTVSCTIKVNELDDVLYIPVEAVFEEYGIPYVYLKTNSGFQRKDIETNQQNEDFIVVTSGLQKGDQIALADPFLNQEEEDK